MTQEVMGFWDGSGINWTMQTIHTSLQADNHAKTDFYRPDALPEPNQKCQSTETMTVQNFTNNSDIGQL